MKIKDLKNKKILIIGKGIEGKSAFEFLKKNIPDCEIDFADQEDGPDYLDKQERYDLAIRSPGVPKRMVKIPSTTATNIFFANAKGTIIGVTGSKGKSTTASLIYAILKEAGKNARLVGNIGSPALSALDKDAEDVIYVAELSSYQLDDIEYSPHISVITNVFPDHMDYHGGFGQYIEAKRKIIARATKKDYFVYNPDYPELIETARHTETAAIPFVKALAFPDNIIPLLGKHNHDNIRAAITVAGLFGVSQEVYKRAVRNFKPLPHRLQFAGEHLGISFYDDAISTTPESTMAAIDSLPKIGTLFAGGKDRGYDFRELARVIAERGIQNLVLFPDSGEKIAEEIKKISDYSPRIFETSSMKDAVRFAYGHNPPGSVCLLSCASPSYSLWKNFEEKGDEFQKWVKYYAGRRTIKNQP